MVNFQLYTPRKLGHLVKYFWCLEVTTLHETPYIEDILPDGHHEIIFQVNKRAKRTNYDNTWIYEPTSFIAGQTLKSYSLELENNSLLYGIRFYPHTLNALFQFPVDIFTENITSIEEVDRIRILQDCISEQPNETFTKLENTLTIANQRIDYTANQLQYVAYAVEEITKRKGNIKIGHLIDKIGITPKYFDTIFKQSVGIGPKAFSNIIKLNHFINYKTINPHKNLTECCFESNFFDQSHLIKLFRVVVGKSPKEYFEVCNLINNYFIPL